MRKLHWKMLGGTVAGVGNSLARVQSTRFLKWYVNRSRAYVLNPWVPCIGFLHSRNSRMGTGYLHIGLVWALRIGSRWDGSARVKALRFLFGLPVVSIYQAPAPAVVSEIRHRTRW
jgi:hypothetical protein